MCVHVLCKNRSWKRKQKLKETFTEPQNITSIYFLNFINDRNEKNYWLTKIWKYFLSKIPKRSSSSLSLKDNEQNKPSPSKQIRRGASALGVINKSKVIVLRREKSIACQATTNHRSLKQSTKPKKPSKQNWQKVDSNGSDDHSLMKKKLLASLNLVASNNSRISRTSSTTSGVEVSSSKNSTNDANSVRHEDSSDNIHRTDVKIIDKVTWLTGIAGWFWRTCTSLKASEILMCQYSIIQIKVQTLNVNKIWMDKDRRTISILLDRIRNK